VCVQRQRILTPRWRVRFPIEPQKIVIMYKKLGVVDRGEVCEKCTGGGCHPETCNCDCHPY